jgi:hypothetical protein
VSKRLSQHLEDDLLLTAEDGDSSYAAYAVPEGDREDSSYAAYAVPEGDREDSSYAAYAVPEGDKEDSSYAAAAASSDDEIAAGDMDSGYAAGPTEWNSSDYATVDDYEYHSASCEINQDISTHDKQAWLNRLLFKNNLSLFL